MTVNVTIRTLRTNIPQIPNFPLKLLLHMSSNIHILLGSLDLTKTQPSRAKNNVMDFFPVVIITQMRVYLWLLLCVLGVLLFHSASHRVWNAISDRSGSPLSHIRAKERQKEERSPIKLFSPNLNKQTIPSSHLTNLPQVSNPWK